MKAIVSLTIKAPEISARLRGHIAALADEPAYLVDHCYAAVMRVEGYASLGFSEKAGVQNSIEMFVKQWCTALLEQAWFTPTEMEMFDAAVRQRVHQGISLCSVMRAFRLGAKELWLAHLGLAGHDTMLRDELLFVVSPYLLEYCDFMGQLIGRVFLDEQFRGTRWRSEVRRRLCDLVFNVSGDEQAFRRVGKSLGFDSTVPRVALAIDYELTDVFKLNPEAAVERLVYAIAPHINASPDHIVYVTRHDRLVVWVPCVSTGSPIFSQRILMEAVIAFAKKSKEVQAIGVGFLNHGPKGWATSAEEAMTALDRAPQSDGVTKVYLYSDIAIDESVRASESTLRYIESMLGEILHEKDLVKTLERYFDNSQHRKATAVSLGIHPNTLNYRLGRIETLLGAKIDAPSWITRLFIALRLHKAIKKHSSPESGY